VVRELGLERRGDSLVPSLPSNNEKIYKCEPSYERSRDNYTYCGDDCLF